MKRFFSLNLENKLFYFVFVFLVATTFAQAQYTAPLTNESSWTPSVLLDSKQEALKLTSYRGQHILTSNPENKLSLQRIGTRNNGIVALDLRSNRVNKSNNSITFFLKTSQSVHNKASHFSLVFSMAIHIQAPFYSLPKSSMFKRTNHLAFLIKADRPTIINPNRLPEPLLPQTAVSLPSIAFKQTPSTLAEANYQIS